jgi:hypothetical protein
VILYEVGHGTLGSRSWKRSPDADQRVVVITHRAGPLGRIRSGSRPICRWALRVHSDQRLRPQSRQPAGMTIRHEIRKRSLSARGQFTGELIQSPL